ncbi:MAG: hypothetical protein WA667_06675 [Candidatus Nitrosopolaris sp.]
MSKSFVYPLAIKINTDLLSTYAKNIRIISRSYIQNIKCGDNRTFKIKKPGFDSSAIVKCPNGINNTGGCWTDVSELSMPLSRA